MSLVSCADQPVVTWGGDRAAGNQQPTENNGCRAYAKQKAEQEYAIAQSSGPALDYSRTTSYRREVDRYDASRRQQYLYKACVAQRAGAQLETEREDQSQESP